MITDEQIISRFFLAIDSIISRGDIRGLQTFTSMHGIDRRNLLKIKKDPQRFKGMFRPCWLSYLVDGFGVSPMWLLTGIGSAFQDTPSPVAVSQGEGGLKQA